MCQRQNIRPLWASFVVFVALGLGIAGIATERWVVLNSSTQAPTVSATEIDIGLRTWTKTVVTQPGDKTVVTSGYLSTLPVYAKYEDAGKALLVMGAIGLALSSFAGVIVMVSVFQWRAVQSAHRKRIAATIVNILGGLALAASVVAYAAFIGAGWCFLVFTLFGLALLLCPILLFKIKTTSHSPPRTKIALFLAIAALICISVSMAFHYWVVDTSSSKITYYIGLKTYLSRTAAGEEASGLLTSIKGNYTNTAMKMDTAGSYVIGLGSAGLLCILGAIAFLTVVIRTPYVHMKAHIGAVLCVLASAIFMLTALSFYDSNALFVGASFICFEVATILVFTGSGLLISSLVDDDKRKPKLNSDMKVHKEALLNAEPV